MSKKSLFLAVLLASCSSENQKNLETNYNQYLACYALEPEAKAICLQEFQFAAEKEGFREFINASGRACEAVEEAPEFIEASQAYVVKCKPNYEYLMQFNYQTKQWKLI